MTLTCVSTEHKPHRLIVFENENMLIRAAQWQALTEAGLVRFELEMVQHLSDFAPELSRVMGEERLYELVQTGIARANQYGFTARGPLRSYLEMMLALGSAFDTDPALSRATAALRTEATDQHHRAGALYEGILEYCEQVNGMQNEHAFAAMKRVRDVAYEALPGGGDITERALILFRSGFPQKFEYVGEPSLRDMLASAIRSGEEYGVQSEAALLLLASLMYAFGHGVFSDPAYRWTDETMRDLRIANAEERARHVHRKTRIYINAALKNLAG